MSNELSPELVGKVANKRFFGKKSPKTVEGEKTLARAVKKKLFQSKVGELKT